jgi:hypothetical protein
MRNMLARAALDGQACDSTGTALPRPVAASAFRRGTPVDR